MTVFESPKNATDFAKNLRGDFLRSVVVKLCNSVQRDSARNLHGDFLRNLHGDFLRNLRVDYAGNLARRAAEG